MTLLGVGTDCATSPLGLASLAWTSWAPVAYIFIFYSVCWYRHTLTQETLSWLKVSYPNSDQKAKLHGKVSTGAPQRLSPKVLCLATDSSADPVELSDCRDCRDRRDLWLSWLCFRRVLCSVRACHGVSWLLLSNNSVLSNTVLVCSHSDFWLQRPCLGGDWSATGSGPDNGDWLLVVPWGSHLRFYIILPFYPVPKSGFDSVLIQDVYRTLKATLWLRPWQLNDSLYWLSKLQEDSDSTMQKTTAVSPSLSLPGHCLFSIHFGFVYLIASAHRITMCLLRRHHTQWKNCCLGPV